jgi:16S rRNA (cytosine967-C5)-methyltransferase
MHHDERSVPLAPLAREAEPRALLMDLFAEARQGWPFLSDLCARTFKRRRPLPSHRAWVAEALHEMVRLHRRVDHGLGLAKGSTDDTARFWATLVLGGHLPVEEAMALAPAQASRLRSLAGLPERVAAESDAAARLGLTYSLPDWLARLLLDELPADRVESMAASFNMPPPQTLRVNTLRRTREEALAILGEAGVEATPTRYASTGLTLRRRGSLFDLSLFQDGSVEVQDEASQLCCEVTAPPPHGLVVDACAGAGGKTLGLAALMGGRGRIVAMDASGSRLAELKRRARRAGVTTVRWVHVSPEEGSPTAEESRVEGDLLGKADRVLVDAPCTGLGALRRNPEARWRMVPEDLSRMAAQQVALSRRALRWVAPGGRLVYATCSFARGECESVVEEILRTEPVERVRVREVLGGARTQGLTDPGGWEVRTWPDLHGMDGFFVSVLRRRA